MQNINYENFYKEDLNSKFHPTGNGWYKVLTKCPFHNDKNHGTYHINVNSGCYYCFSCGCKGNIFQYLYKQKGMCFKQSINYLKENGYAEC